ncbi:unnamed protein product [Ectocarpus sp. 12 AP-2014]
MCRNVFQGDAGSLHSLSRAKRTCACPPMIAVVRSCVPLLLLPRLTTTQHERRGGLLRAKKAARLDLLRQLRLRQLPVYVPHWGRLHKQARPNRIDPQSTEQTYNYPRIRLRLSPPSMGCF